MTSLCLPKLRVAGALAFIVTTIFVACGVPDYNVPTTPDAGGIPPAGTGGKSGTSVSTGGSTSSSAGGSTSNGTGGGNATGGQAPQLENNCTSDANCSGFSATKKCNTATKQCVECLDDSSCGTGLYCDTTDLKCHVGCSSSTACGTTTGDASPGTPLTCNLTTHQCTGCESDLDCKLGTECDPVSGSCVPGCGSDKNCSANWSCCGGLCANLQSDANHCALCATSCAQTQAVVQCDNGTCKISKCNDGYLDCDKQWSTGCEVDKLSDNNNCGVCGTICPTASQQACINGVCGSASCATPGFKNCNNDPTGACLTNTNADAANCGGCGNVCSKNNDTPSCDAGKCVISCTSGFADCNANVVDGCEVDLNATAAHCGSCTQACANDHGGASCSAGKCVPSCLSGYDNCDGDPTNGCEANLTNDPTHCGSCAACSLPNATAACTNSSCTIATCQPNTADCNGIASDGCETNLQTTAAHCGACTTACNSTNGTATCSAGTCGITCATGFDNCDGNMTNGCEVDLTKSVDHCGTCSTMCADQPNGTAICKSGVCGVSNCTAPFGDCDGLPANGCEANEDVDPTNCGGCGNRCVVPHATPKCTIGVCGISTCDAGWADCDGNPANGCEVNLMTDVGNCHACGSVCAPANAVGACVAGTCTVTLCKGNFQDCDKIASNGCEADTSSSVSNCGQCAAACNSNHGTPSCSGGVCSITCAAGFGNCDGNVNNGCEATTTNDAGNCGACGTTCVAQNGTAACLNSVCTVSSCNAGFQNCDGKYSNGCEANLSTDLSNCGACTNVCNSTSGTATCTSGQCGITCTSGFGNCDNLVANGCETNLGTSLQNCGVCNQVCAPANAVGACASGACSISSCNTGFANCNAVIGDGCEANLTSDPQNCNTCAHVCSFSHAAAGCNSGACTLGTCSAGYADCDGLPGNGCEVSLTTDATHCGTCNTVCAYANAAATCSNGTCAIGACNANFANCDGVAANGCEVNLQSDVNNCGGCGAAFKCPTTGGTASCTSGVCGYSTCGAGLATCPPGATCATNTTNDVNNCGGCGTKCTYANAAASCASSTCSMGACTAGFGNCDGAPANGCESNLKTDALNCNACNTRCTFANAAASCVNGACTMGACNAGYADCDGNPANGCEVNLKTDANNCNACSNTQPSAKCNATNGTATCNNGTCQIACSPGYADCNLNAADGCEINKNTSTSNCGACNTVCNSTNGTATCSGGTCGITCNAGYGNCNGLPGDGCEVNTNTNVNYCGSCNGTNSVCGTAHGTPSCSGGVCSIACASGYGNCDGITANGCEATLSTDSANCGSCANACTYANASGVCSGSVCSMGTCNTGYGNCINGSSDGCETPLTTTSNCGSCGNACTNAHGTTTCTSSNCVPTCSTGYASCDNNLPNGCEQNIATDVLHCGSCTTACSYANATPVCSSSTCSMGACSYLYGNCNNNPADGCERPLAADTSNCGACNNACGTANGTASCSAGACSISCNAGYLDCDGLNPTGCEANSLTDANNCGTCGHVCPYGCTNGACNTPCTGLCSSPTQFPGGTYSQTNLGVAAFCYETTGAINGGGCSNFVAPRTLSVNGTVMNCVGWTVPARRNGGYCVYGPAGGHTYDAFNTW